MDLPLTWAAIILFGILMYVVLDGFDLGLGILYPFFRTKDERDVIMNSIAPVWDGNETWLVLGGAGLLAAFPLAYAVILSALSLPLTLMLLALVLRGVAFEFRFKADEHERNWWNKAFIGGSIAATFFQGVVLGAYIRGIPVATSSGVTTETPWTGQAPYRSPARSTSQARLRWRSARLDIALLAIYRHRATRHLRPARQHVADH